jgi:hypothetical protein
MKKIFKSQWGKIFFYLIAGNIFLIIISFFYRKGPVYLLLPIYFFAIYGPIFVLLRNYFYPLLLEKLKLEPSEKMIFEGVYNYIIFLPLWAIVFSVFIGHEIKSETSLFFSIIFFIIVFSLGFFSFCIIPPILKVKKMKKE